MATITTVSNQWASRPVDERFLSLNEMAAKLHARRAVSRAIVTSSRALRVAPTDDNRGLQVMGRGGVPYAPTHWAFGQLSSLVGAPAGYLRSLPAPVAADCINYGLQVERDAQDIGVLIAAGGENTLRAATGPQYGRIWNTDIVDTLIDRFGDGINGQWRVPGEWGRKVVVNRDNTTLYAGDRDLFVFLADEENRLPVQTRGNGEPDTLARGFLISNSEEGAATLQFRAFLFDYVCGNRIIWGAQEVANVKIRHTASAPDRYLEEVVPQILAYSQSSTTGVVDKVKLAQQTKVDKLGDFLANRFGPRVAPRIIAAHEVDEARPMETVWDVVTGVTAYARGIPFQADRVALEAEAGSILEMV
jgi:hypothetical protein